METLKLRLKSKTMQHYLVASVPHVVYEWNARLIFSRTLRWQEPYLLEYMGVILLWKSGTRKARVFRSVSRWLLLKL